MRELRRFRAALRRVATRGARSQDPLPDLVREAASALGVARSGVWLLSDDGATLTARVHLDVASDCLTGGTVLRRADHPGYFEAVASGALIDVDDALTDPRTRDLAGIYLLPARVGAILDVPITLDGRLLGVVCHEHVGGPRAWTERERTYAGSVADLMALALETEARRAAERALADREAHLSLALDAARMGSWSWDLERDEVTWGEQLGPLFGWGDGFSPGSLEGFLEIVHPEDRDALATVLRQSLDAPTSDYHVQHRMLRPDGEPLWFEGRGRYELDETGRPVLLRGIVADVTERVQLERQLERAGKLEAVGRLVSGVAHDFNNALAAILASADHLERAPAEQHPELVETIRRVAERAAGLTRDLLFFARGDRRQPGRCDLTALTREVTRMARRTLGERVHLQVDLPDLALHVPLHPWQAERILLNLLLNARDALPEGGVIRVHLDGGDGAADPVRLSVEDEGVGMTEEVQRRAFDPFFTTKTEGTGLGLSSSYGIVRDAGGTVQLHSRPGDGTRIVLDLPRADGPTGPDHGEDPPEEVLTVLLVEDDPHVRRSVQRLLAGDGHRVVAVAGLEEAESVALDGVDVLLTDMVLQDGSGGDLAMRLTERRPGLGVVTMSGYAPEPVPDLGRPPQFLAKPFSRRDLRRALALAAAGG